MLFEALTVDGALRGARPGGGRGSETSGGSRAGGGDGGEAAVTNSESSATQESDSDASSQGQQDEEAAAPQFAWNIYYIDADGGPPQPYRTTDDNETRPALSPGGTLLAYVSDASGASEVWVDTFPQPSEPVRISVSGGGYVRWSGSGDELIYDDGADTLWSVRVDTRAAHGRAAYGDPERLFEQGDAATRFTTLGTRSWDVGRDGDGILTIQRYAEGLSDVNVIENFPRWYRESR